MLACALPLMILSGCITNRESIEKRLVTGTLPDRPNIQPAETYLVGSPDVLEITVLNRPDASGQSVVDLDGRINLGRYQRLRVEGRSVPEISRLIAGRAGVSPGAVKVRVAEYRSQPLFLLGQVAGWQRTIPYQGQETVLEVLQRVGGLTAGAAPEDVYVVRAHVADGQRPEAFHVDLSAVVIKNDPRSNIRVLPYDQIYVGQSRQSKVLKCLPPWLKPAFLAVWGPMPSRPDARSLQLRRMVPRQTDGADQAGPPAGASAK
jgi:protein involved in polysaccharide export with SLBB domain